MKDKRNKGRRKTVKGLFRKGFYGLVSGVVIGVAVAFIIKSFVDKPDDGIPPLIYTPNAMAERKPIYMQILKTQQDVDNVKATRVYLSDKVTVGTGVRVGKKGLDVYLKTELDSPTIHIRDIAPQIKDKVVIGGYTYIPNVIVTSDPSPVQILETPEDVAMARKMKGLTYKQFLGVGAAIRCPDVNPCYVIGAEGVRDRLTVKPFVASKPKDNSSSKAWSNKEQKINTVGPGDQNRVNIPIEP